MIQEETSKQAFSKIFIQGETMAKKDKRLIFLLFVPLFNQFSIKILKFWFESFSLAVKKMGLL